MPKTKISVASVGTVDSMETSKTLQKWELNTTTDKITSDDVKRSNCLVSALRPLLISMSLMGFFDVWKILEYGNENTGCSRRFFKAYQLAMICVLVFNFIRFFLAYGSFDFGSELLSTILLHSWFLLGLVYAIISYRMVQNPTKLISFFNLWRKYWKMVNNVQNDIIVEQVCSWRQIRKYTSVCTFIGWCVAIGNIGFTCYTVISATAFKNMIDPFPRSHTLFPIVAGIFLVVVLYISCVWVFTSGLIIVLTLSLCHEFKKFVQRMERMTQHKSMSEVQKNMEAMRRQHNALCNMLDTGNDVLKCQIGLCLVVHIFLTLILIYNMCWYEVVRTDAGQLVTHMFWLSGSSIILIAMMAACCLLNIQAHEPAKLIYNLSMREITAEFALQINVFLHRLNGAPIGLTAWSLFVVDNQVVVSVAGMLATYFVVLLQFQQASGTPIGGGNATVV